MKSVNLVFSNAFWMTVMLPPIFSQTCQDFHFTVSQHHHCTHSAYSDGWHRWELDGEKTLPWNSWFAEVGIVHLCSMILLQTFLLSMGDFWTCYSLRLKFESRCPPKCMSRQTTRSGRSCESLTDILFYQVACEVVLTKSDVLHLRIVEKAPKQVDVRQLSHLNMWEQQSTEKITMFWPLLSLTILEGQGGNLPEQRSAQVST